MDQMDSTSKIQAQALDFALTSLKHGIRKVGPMIDKMTSASLKRVLKTISHVHIADSVVNGSVYKLSQDEENLIDSILALQEDVLGYTQVYNEIYNNQENSEQSEENRGEENDGE